MMIDRQAWIERAIELCAICYSAECCAYSEGQGQYQGEPDGLLSELCTWVAEAIGDMDAETIRALVLKRYAENKVRYR